MNCTVESKNKTKLASFIIFVHCNVTNPELLMKVSICFVLQYTTHNRLCLIREHLATDVLLLQNQAFPLYMEGLALQASLKLDFIGAHTCAPFMENGKAESC